MVRCSANFLVQAVDTGFGRLARSEKSVLERQTAEVSTALPSSYWRTFSSSRLFQEYQVVLVSASITSAIHNRHAA